MADIPHFAFPFERGANGKVNVVEQDSADHVMSCEQVIVRCPVGWRDERPDFGWPFPEFATMPVDLSALEEALRRFEPRGDARATEWADTAETAVQHILIEVETTDG